MKQKRVMQTSFLILLLILTTTTVLAETPTNCSITTVTVQDGGNGTIFGGIVFILVGFAALYFMPKIIGNPDQALKDTWKGILDDTWRRGVYIGMILLYLIAGSWLYQNAADNGIEMTDMFIMFVNIINVLLYVLLAWMLLKIIIDVVQLIKKYTEAERYGRNYKET